jgi:H+/Cl- antiporter ClcA
MDFPPPVNPEQRRAASVKAILGQALHYWHRGAAWILGPLFIGLVAVGFATGSEYANRMSKNLLGAVPFAPLLVMPAGFALCAWLSKRFFPGTQGSGIPQTIAAIDTIDGSKKSTLLSLRIATGKIILTLLALLFGASIGREGPTVQVGASIMHAFYARGPFQTVASRRTLILAGGAAGIAAAFNTPLAGIMFAIEELSKKHVFNANSSVLITVVLSGLIPLALLGNYTYFGSSGVYMDWTSAMTVVFACGAAGGLGGGLFSRLLRSGSFLLPTRLGVWVRHLPIAFAGICGLALALLGLATSGVIFGTGYEATRLTLEDTAILPWYFGVAKLLATLLSSISGIPGGIFAPSLAVGAGFGENLFALFPSMAPHGATILLAMAAYLSGVTRAPVTSFIIMMEMTDSHHMLLPLMATSLVAAGISKLLSPQPLYHALAERFMTPHADIQQLAPQNKEHG